MLNVVKHPYQKRHNLPSTPSKLRSLNRKENRLLAVEMIKSGQTIGFYNRGVNALIGDPKKDQFTAEIIRIKGGNRANKTIAMMSYFEHIQEYVDFSNTPKNLRHILSNSTLVSQHLGSLCFLRLPINNKGASKLHNNFISENNGLKVIQVWDPTGHLPAEDIMNSSISAGIKHLGITSMNNSGEPEIVDQKLAIEFSEQKDIPLYLFDNKDKAKVRGSYTIINMVGEQVQLIRHGHLPVELFESILMTKINIIGASPSKYPQLDMSDLQISANERPQKIRSNVVKYLRT